MQRTSTEVRQAALKQDLLSSLVCSERASTLETHSLTRPRAHKNLQLNEDESWGRVNRPTSVCAGLAGGRDPLYEQCRPACTAACALASRRALLCCPSDLPTKRRPAGGTACLYSEG